MTKIVLLQFHTDPDAGARRDALRASGAVIAEGEPRWPAFFDIIERERPNAVVIAYPVLGQHAREAARYLGDGFNTRDIPVYLVDVPARDLDKARASAPRATIVDRAQLASAISH